MLLFETASLPRWDRADAATSVMLDATLSSHVVHKDPADVRLHVEQWDFGPMSLWNVQTSALRMTRTPRQAKADQPPVIALSLQDRPGGVQVQDDDPLRARPGSFFLVDLSRPYISDIETSINGWSIKIPLDQLGLPLELVTSARPRLRDSPVLDVFHRHCMGIIADPDRLHDDVAGRLVGASTVALARALIASAAHDEAYAPATLADVMVTRIRSYVSAHLSDPQLQPATIAAAHHISLRALYQVCAKAEVRLEQLIIQERLERARDELALPHAATRSIGATALRWGFTSTSHFSHRFRAAYGMSPRDWQRLSAGPPQSPPP